MKEVHVSAVESAEPTVIQDKKEEEKCAHWDSMYEEGVGLKLA